MTEKQEMFFAGLLFAILQQTAQSPGAALIWALFTFATAVLYIIEATKERRAKSTGAK